ncbi:Cytochrome c [Rubripirellula tenax]|uniref:Cytochrome c n=1 Tax=Rubripirellula tenax TaxID=2528015 RepID=A0A5C6FI54_9BACT|nr:PVC-type heme-binding CxxCH protein [Rubripirellula tenax]TWU60570.1 Cytochrome c [Rubripirellula tenax]
MNPTIIPARRLLARLRMAGISVAVTASTVDESDNMNWPLFGNVCMRFLLAFGTVAISVTAAAAKPPVVIDPDLTMELVTSEPTLVTPTGCCFDDAGRLLVIESHTHFPPEDYDGPKVDRIYRFDDSDGDRIVDRPTLFYEGGEASMNIANLGDGSFAVASRSQVIRIADRDDDGRAEALEVLLTHETKANYPHNGLGGLTLGSDGWLYVGQGENFGEPYQVIGSDGSRQVGGGEGGNIFRCRPDGSDVQRVATGFWNPFGLTMDGDDRFIAVDNDPDAMPPNRLLHVVMSGDYGFQFRFGRAGTHPLQCWNGELPGTLPMVTGTGEAVCAVAVVGDQLWTTSWGDNRIERYSMSPRGESFQSETEVLVQGGADFRPVGMAVAPDGSVYITDWIDRSYSVHRKGRLWRISRKVDSPQPATQSTSPSPGSVHAKHDPLQSLASDDPFVRQSGIARLASEDRLSKIDASRLTAAQQVGVLTAWRWRSLCDPQSVSDAIASRIIAAGLQSESSDVLVASMRWATERGDKQWLPAITNVMNRDDGSASTFAAAIASIAYLETGSASGKTRDPATEQRLFELASDESRSPQLRAFAVERIPFESDLPSDETLGTWLVNQPDRKLAHEVVRLLTARRGDSANEVLESIVGNPSLDPQTRADALAGLSMDHAHATHLMQDWASSDQPIELSAEAVRVGSNPATDHGTSPPASDLDAWDALVGDGGDPDAGARVFLRRQCAACHMHSGRGARTGPDLTTLAGRMSRRRVLESILQPSKEVGPLYVPWMVLTTDGIVRTGIKLHAPGVGQAARYQGADGTMFDIPLNEIEIQKATETSIMPTGLERSMSVDEMRDLLKFLVQ